MRVTIKINQYDLHKNYKIAVMIPFLNNTITLHNALIILGSPVVSNLVNIYLY